MREVKLNLGCSDDLKPGWVNVDIALPADVVTDLRNRWPWEDSIVDVVFAHDVAEHMNQIHFLNEAWRVLKPGGILDIAVPGFFMEDGHTVNPGAVCDPTHVMPFWTIDSQYYFCEEWNHPGGERGRLGPAYGIRALFRPQVWRAQDYGNPGQRRSKLIGLWEALK